MAGSLPSTAASQATTPTGDSVAATRSPEESRTSGRGESGCRPSASACSAAPSTTKAAVPRSTTTAACPSATAVAQASRPDTGAGRTSVRQAAIDAGVVKAATAVAPLVDTGLLAEKSSELALVTPVST